MNFMFGSKEEESKYAQHNNDRYLYILSYLRTIIPPLRVINILDIGTSPFTFLFKQSFPIVKIYSSDYSDTFKQRCKEKNIIFKKYDLSKPNKPIFNKRFDIICFLETLEHIKADHRDVLRMLIKLMNKDSYLIIQTPNKYSFKSFVLKIIPRIWSSNTLKYKVVDGFTHVKEYSLSELTTELRKFKELDIVKAGYPIYYDKVTSSLVYRKNPQRFKPLLYLYFLFVSLLPPLRAGLEIVVKKI